MTTTKTSNAKTKVPLPNLPNNNNTTQPWEQQPGESDLLYSYFTIYKDIPTHIRTVKKTWETLKENKKNLNLNYLQQLAAEHKWQQRVRAWDKHMSQLTISSKEMNVKKMNDKHFNVGKTCIDSLMGDLEDPELNTVPVDKRAYVKQALIRGMEGAVRIQRLALGESTSNTKQVNEGINNLMMVLTDSKKQLQKQQKKDVIDIEAEVIQTEK
jgi:hypothetical protein